LLAAAFLAAAFWLGPTIKDGMSLALAVMDNRQHNPPQEASIVSGLPGRQLVYEDADAFVAYINDV